MEQIPLNLVTVKSFDSGISARIVMNRLEDEGIECFIHDEHMIDMNPLVNYAIGGVKLKVRQVDLERAKAILQEIDAQPYTDDQEQPIQCPKCGSTELYAHFKSMKGVRGVLSALTSFLLAVFPIYYREVYRCKQCETEFKV